jgi:hypothetical protein
MKKKVILKQNSIFLIEVLPNVYVKIYGCHLIYRVRKNYHLFIFNKIFFLIKILEKKIKIILILFFHWFF